MTRDLYAVLGDLTREIAQHPVSADDDERIEGDVIEALSRRANYREAMRKRGRLEALYATQRAAEPWMEPLATRLWGKAARGPIHHGAAGDRRALRGAATASRVDPRSSPASP